MSKEKKKFFHKNNIIKWYEYTMDYGNTNEETEPENSGEDEAFDFKRELSEEELSAKMAELDDGDQALVADIMARFQDAKQSLVDGLFEDDFAPTEDSGQESEEDIISQICAPKQNNVDSFINMAKGI